MPGLLRHIIIAAVALCGLTAAALGQTAVLSGTPYTPYHAPMYVGSGSQGSQAVVIDSGPAGGASGLGMSEGLYVQRCANPVNGICVATGTGPNGSNWCDYDTPNGPSNSGGYHYFCINPNSGANVLLSAGSVGVATPLPFGIYQNGIVVALPIAPGNVWATISGSFANGHIACGQVVNGSLTLIDCGGSVGAGVTSLGGATGVITLGGNGLAMSGNALALGAGVATNTLNVQLGAYTLATTDCGKTVILSGTAFYTLTIPSVSGFASNCTITVVNVDNTRGKTISGLNLPNKTSLIPNILWPDQSFTLSLEDGAWFFLAAPQRWKLSNSVTFYTDFTNGSDSNDGLSTGAGNALKTVSQCLSDIEAITDQGAGSTQVTCQMAASSTDSTLVHFSATGGNAPGALSTNSIVIDGNGSATLSGGVQAYYNAVFELQNVTISGAGGGGCVASNFNSIIVLVTNVTFTGCGNDAAINANNGGRIWIFGSVTWNQTGTGFFILAQDHSLVAAQASFTVTVNGNSTVTDTVAANYLSDVNLLGVSWSLGPYTVTSTHPYVCAGNAVILGAAEIPGSNSGSTASGCQAID